MYKRKEDLVRHTKKCLEQYQDNQKNQPTSQALVTTDLSTTPSAPITRINIDSNTPSSDIKNVHVDLTVSDSEDDNDIILSNSKKLESVILCRKMSREVNTTISCLHMVDKVY